MSDLLKKALKKNAPPKDFDEEEEDQEEEKDIYEDPTSHKTVHKEFQHMTGPIKAVPLNMTKPPMPGHQHDHPYDPNQIEIPKTIVGGGAKTNQKDYTPQQWSEYFDTMEYLPNGTPLYTAGEDCPIFFCLHGAGDSACSFACLAKEVKQFGTLIAFDYRGHGQSKYQNQDDLSQKTLIQDTLEVFEYVINKHPQASIIVVGHSMGGSIAAKFVQETQNKYSQHIQGLIVIDVVEGTAIEALPYMESIVSSRPQRFDSLEGAIKWHLRTNQVRNLQSARVSTPQKFNAVQKEDGKTVYEWKVDLMKTDKFWLEWFKGLTGAFLSVPIPKLLMLAEKERMDKELTIAQMQGKFKLVVIQDVGHYMQEDNFKKTAYNLHQFCDNFRIPINIQEISQCKAEGIGKFHPKIKPYNIKMI